MTTIPTFLRSATELSAMVRRREVSAGEVTAALLARIQELNPALNAVVEVQEQAALLAAAAADRAVARGHELGLLHGVPMTVKESFQVAGMRTTWGVPAFADRIADWDATVIRRLRGAGAIVIGTTNVAPMLADFAQTANDVHGRTNNPWDLTRSPGGSSGGAAAAVAAGLSFLEYGSDLSGSLRIPAAFCGVYCLRPTAGTVPSTGLQPSGPPAPRVDAGDLLVVGPLARSAADLRAALRATAGPEHPEDQAYTWQLAPPRHRRLEDFRVGVVLDHPDAPVSREVADVLAATVDRIATAGATVVAGWPDGINPTIQAESFGFHVDLFLAHHEPGAAIREPERIVAQQRARTAARAAWADYFRDIDVFLSPAALTPAIPHDARPWHERTVTTSQAVVPYAAQSFWSAHASLSGLPAVVAPVGATPSGLPVGVQLVAPAHEDDTAITFAELLADLTALDSPPHAFHG